MHFVVHISKLCNYCNISCKLIRWTCCVWHLGNCVNADLINNADCEMTCFFSLDMFSTHLRR